MSGALSVLKTLLNPLLKSIPQGAATQVYLATAKSVAGGEVSSRGAEVTSYGFLGQGELLVSRARGHQTM